MLSFILFDLTLREVIADIPHDATAVVVYLLVAVFAGLVWAGSRGSVGGDDPEGGSRDA